MKTFNLWFIRLPVHELGKHTKCWQINHKLNIICTHYYERIENSYQDFMPHTPKWIDTIHWWFIQKKAHFEWNSQSFKTKLCSANYEYKTSSNKPA